jgi:hypothetical protein
VARAVKEVKSRFWVVEEDWQVSLVVLGGDGMAEQKPVVQVLHPGVEEVLRMVAVVLR